MLPPSLLALIESHGCFSGCYDYRSDLAAIVYPGSPPERMLHVECEDCLSFHVSVLASLLPAAMSASQLARMLTEHMRTLRGYAWSVGGYHASPSSLWLSAAYYPCGIVLISGERNSQQGDDLDCLMEGFQHKIINASDPAMLQPANYRTQVVYLDMSQPITPVRDAGDILSSPQCSTTYRPHYRKVTLAEFLPAMRNTTSAPAGLAPGGTLPSVAPPAAIAHAATAPNARPLPAPSTDTVAQPARPLGMGERCPKCGAVVKERPSLTDTFIGCLC